jgi:hypothetical protein
MNMFDVKIVAAVLASLAAVAVTTSGGQISDVELDNAQELNLESDSLASDPATTL